MTTPRDESTAPRGASLVSARVEDARTLARSAQRSRAVRTYSHFIDVGGGVLAGGMSYQALFAVFAALWLGFGLLGIVLRGNDQLLETLVGQINSFIPGLVGDSGVVQLSSLLRASSFNWTSIVAGVTLTWVAINWFTGTRRSIRLIFGLEVKQYRNPVLLKLRDLALAAIFFVAVLLSALLTLFSSNLTALVFTWLGLSTESWFFGWLGLIARYAALFAFDVLVLIAIHRLLAEVRVPWWRLVRGCALGGVALLLLKIAGNTIIGSTSNPLLASFALLIGLLVWFNVICRALLLTASWIATGENPSLGLPKRLLSPALG